MHIYADSALPEKTNKGDETFKNLTPGLLFHIEDFLEEKDRNSFALSSKNFFNFFKNPANKYEMNDHSIDLIDTSDLNDPLRGIYSLDDVRNGFSQTPG